MKTIRGMKHSVPVLFIFLIIVNVKANKKTGIFEKLGRALGDENEATSASTEKGIFGSTVINNDSNSADDNETSEHRRDVWGKDPTLKLLEKAFGQEHTGILRSLAYTEGLEEIWSKPDVVRKLLDNFSVFKGIKGMKAIAAKQEPLTSEDGLLALKHFQDFITASAKAIESIMEPGSFAEKLDIYAKTNDPVLIGLMRKMELGDAQAALDLQQELVNRELGDIVDLNEFGLRASEPQAVQQLRKMVQEEPDFYKMIHQGDPLVKKYLDDPGLAFEEAKKISPTLQNFGL